MIQKNSNTYINKRRIGSSFEDKAANILSEHGYRILRRNYRCKTGEIDLIARKDEYLVFIEVKYRNSTSFGYGMESVDKKKQKRIINAARWYLTVYSDEGENLCRFDVVSFFRDKVTIIENAFECD